jgi:Domain of unknown function (DUF4234)
MSTTPPPPGSVPAGQPAGGGTVPRTLSEVWYKPGLNILLAVVTLGVWTWVWTYHTAEDLKRHSGDGLGGVISLVLAIFINPVVWFTIPNEIKMMYQRDGRESPVSALWGLWFLLPIIGNFVWYLKMQRTLNEFWLSKGASAA